MICTLCGTGIHLTHYVQTHRFEHHAVMCQCGARYDLYDGEAELVKTTEARPTEWFLSPITPVHMGWYQVRFPNGVESNRNWWWDGMCFRYDCDSPATLQLGSINAWRGLNRRA